MGCLISCIACEAASCLCCGLTKCCGRVLPTGIAGRIGYTLLFFVVSFFAWILRGWADEILSWIPVLKICEDRQCFGILAIYRLTFALATFHLLHSVMLIGCKDKSDMRAKIQDGFWLIKVVIFIAITIGAFFIPNEFFEVYGWIALIGSLFFILVQLMMLVDFAHSWAEKWIGNYEESGEERGTWWWILLGSSIVLYAISVTLTIVMYIFFVQDAVGCQLNAAFITLNLIFNIGIGALSIHPRIQEANPRSGILQSSFITGYVTYLVWSALMSEPVSNGCNPWAASSGASTVALIIGSAFTIIAVCFSTFNTATTFKDDHDQAPLLADKPKDEENTETPAEEESGPLPYNLSIFHIVFVLGSFYVCMLMSDWFTVDKENETSLKVDSGMASVWVKIVSSWLAILLYVWTLMGPILFPDRDWGVQSFA